MARMGERPMLDPFDIFKVERNGSVRWVRAIPDLERAKSYVLKVLAMASSADYIILNQRTGERTVIRATLEQYDLHIKIPSPAASSRN
jgi:hypothetical protein